MIPLVAGLWLGGLIAIDLVEAPTKFKIRSIERSSAVELGQAVFRKFGFLEMAFSTALLFFAFDHHDSATIWLAYVLAGIALVISPWLRNRLAKLIERQSGKELLRPYHKAYVVLDIVKMLLLVSIALLAVSGK